MKTRALIIDQDVLVMDSTTSSPANTLIAVASGITDENGQVVLSKLKADTYDLQVEATDYNKLYYNTNQNIDSSTTIDVVLEPLYDLIFSTGQEGALINITGSFTGTGTTGTDGTYTFKNVPFGTIGYTVSKEGFETITVTAVNIDATSNAVNIDATLGGLPKLVQITTNQTDYVLEQHYKYVSILAVGKGGNAGQGGVFGAGGGGGGAEMLVHLNTPIISTPINITIAGVDSETQTSIVVGDVSLTPANGGDGGRQMGSTGDSSVGGTGGGGGQSTENPGNSAGGGGGGTGWSGINNGAGGVGGAGGSLWTNGGAGTNNTQVGGRGGTAGLGHNNIVIDKNLFNITGVGGAAGASPYGTGSGAGGGAGYGNGGAGGKGGNSGGSTYGENGGFGAGGGSRGTDAGAHMNTQVGAGGPGIICLYYHNNLLS